MLKFINKSKTTIANNVFFTLRGSPLLSVMNKPVRMSLVNIYKTI